MTKIFVKFFRVIRNRKVMKYIPGNSRMLDVGCGSDAYLLGSIRNRIKSGIGVDIAAKNSKAGNITTRKMSINRRLPFRPGAFDVVTMIAFIEHLEKPGKILAECSRVLRKGGLIIITTPMARARPFWELLVNLGLTEEKSTEEHRHYFQPQEIENLLKTCGFGVSVSRKFELGMNYIAVGKKT